MTTGKKLAIALAVALPLIVLGAGMAMAADSIPGLKTGDGATLPSFGASNNVEVTSPPADCDGCTGNCKSGTGECSGSGDCISGGGVCDGSSNSGGGWNCCRNAANSDGCAGNCSGAAAPTTPSNGVCAGCTR